jgi:hypothetical protein
MCPAGASARGREIGRKTPVNTPRAEIDPKIRIGRCGHRPWSDINARVRFSVVIAFATALCGVSRVAKSEPAREALRLEYRAFSGCDDATQFLAALRARAPRVRIATPDEDARSFTIEITSGTPNTRARLTIREPSGAKTVRELVAKDCREAVDAIALVAALAVDPQALGTQNPAPSAKNDAPTKGDTAGSASDRGDPEKGRAAQSAEPDRAAPGGAMNSATSSRAERVAAAPSRDERTATATSFGWAASVAMAARSGLAPEWFLGGRVGIAVESRAALFSPSFRLWGEYAPRTTFAVQGGNVAFSYAGAMLEICPMNLRIADGFRARPCLLGDLGMVRASGLDVPNPRSADRLRIAFGAQARFEWMLSRRIGIDLALGCTFPIRRDRYRFDPLLVYEPPAGGLTASAGASLHFP